MRKSAISALGARVRLRPPRKSDEAAFLKAARASCRLHGRWAKAPTTPAEFAAFLKRYGGRRSDYAGYLVERIEDNALCGVFNFSQIVRTEVFQSSYLGYFAFAPHHGGGYMTEGLALALEIAFGELDLHRVEANVQPANRRSLALVNRIGFTREGYSRRYLKMAGRWRDHVRFAMLAEDWRVLRRKLASKKPADRRR